MSNANTHYIVVNGTNSHEPSAIIEAQALTIANLSQYLLNMQVQSLCCADYGYYHWYNHDWNHPEIEVEGPIDFDFRSVRSHSSSDASSSSGTSDFLDIQEDDYLSIFQGSSIQEQDFENGIGLGFDVINTLAEQDMDLLDHLYGQDANLFEHYEGNPDTDVAGAHLHLIDEYYTPSLESDVDTVGSVLDYLTAGLSIGNYTYCSPPVVAQPMFDDTDFFEDNPHVYDLEWSDILPDPPAAKPAFLFYVQVWCNIAMHCFGVDVYGTIMECAGGFCALGMNILHIVRYATFLFAGSVSKVAFDFVEGFVSPTVGLMFLLKHTLYQTLEGFGRQTYWTIPNSAETIGKTKRKKQKKQKIKCGSKLYTISEAAVTCISAADINVLPSPAYEVGHLDETLPSTRLGEDYDEPTYAMQHEESAQLGFGLPRHASRKSRKHEALILKRHAKLEQEATILKYDDVAVTAEAFFWEIQPGHYAWVKASLEEVEEHATKNFTYSACNCIDASTTAIYQGLKTDPVTAQLVCVMCAQT